MGLRGLSSASVSLQPQLPSEAQSVVAFLEGTGSSQGHNPAVCPTPDTLSPLWVSLISPWLPFFLTKMRVLITVVLPHSIVVRTK